MRLRYTKSMVKLVGILNVTPDSFSDGGQFFDPQMALAHAEQLFEDGAYWVDVGAESTRPNAEPLTANEEWRRLQPVLEVLLPAYPGRISLDSYHPETIEKAFTIGPVIVNDVTGMNDPAMRSLVVRLSLPKVIISHLRGLNIQNAHKETPISSVETVRDELLLQARLLEQAGLIRSHIVLDPGIGFGKTPELNKELLKFAALVPAYEVMIGYSRKRFLGEHRMELEPNLTAGRVAVARGATYLRVHDVAGHAGLV